VTNLLDGLKIQALIVSLLSDKGRILLLTKLWMILYVT